MSDALLRRNNVLTRVLFEARAPTSGEVEERLLFDWCFFIENIHAHWIDFFSYQMFCLVSFARGRIRRNMKKIFCDCACKFHKVLRF